MKKKLSSIRKVLVTGGAGYLGSVLCEHLLDAGYKVKVVDNLMYRQLSLFHLCNNPDFEFICGDVRDARLMKGAVKNVDAIIPLAAIVGAPACDKDPWLAQGVNFEAIKSLNRMRSKDQLMVMPTTNSGYGAKSGEVFCTEETPLEPISLYGRTKAQAESEILSKPNAISFRLATVFGMSPRMRLDLLVNHFVYTAVTDKYLVLFEKDFKRNFVHIRDVADCFLYALDNPKKMIGQIFNVGLDSANISKAELALEIAEFVPGFYVHFSDVGTDPDKRNYIVSNRKLKDVGFEAVRTLDQGIRELIKGYGMMRGTQFTNL